MKPLDAPTLADDRVSPLWHAVPWLLALAFYFMAAGYHSLGTNILVYILLTLSLDLALGYAGIIRSATPLFSDLAPTRRRCSRSMSIASR